MRPLLYTSIVLLFLSSCITSTHIHYSDPNYLASNEFSSYDDIVTEPIAEIEQTQYTDTITDDYYSEYDVADDYYDYSFSSRIRRFHRPMYYSNYYGGLYTDYYWYNNDPFYCGTSIYFGYNWNSPYYSYYSYSPYYYNNYNSYYTYGYSNHQHHTPNYTYYNSNNNHTTGHRGSLSSHSIGRGVKTNTIIPNTVVNTSTLNIKNGNTLKNNTNSIIKNTSITTKPYRENTSIKTNTNRDNTTTKTNNSYRVNTSIKTSTKKGNRSYTAPRYNSSKRNYNSGSSKSNSGNRPSRSSNRRSVKPRK
ncbi:MAG: hypothetical protein HN522_04470 [Flavobacteriales bacterium]|nr:hypothetical protein [Flavobacteriales bacterium]MBT5089716.1 hypothetical protein [Flavobacteriales bacterium]MBT5750902.1 hypothetical protein [Flavobacteriales bacterium]